MIKYSQHYTQNRLDAAESKIIMCFSNLGKHLKTHFSFVKINDSISSDNNIQLQRKHDYYKVTT